MEDKPEKVIVYRNQWEKDADEFWHSDAGMTCIFWLVVGTIILVGGLFGWQKWRERRS